MKLLDIGQEAKVTDKKAAIVQAVAKSTGKTELAQGGYVYAIYSIVTTVNSCQESLSLASFSCVSLDQWVMLSGFISMAYATLRGKIKEDK